jgi:hypothetical protein
MIILNTVPIKSDINIVLTVYGPLDYTGPALVMFLKKWM